MNSFASTSMVNSMQRVNGDPYLGKFGPGRIGSWDGGGREWEGMFDEMLLFDVALEEEDIQMLMENGLEDTLAVEAAGKLATNWGKIKLGRTHSQIGMNDG